MVDSPYLVPPGKKFKLSAAKTDDVGKFKGKEDAAEETANRLKRLAELQEVLYGDNRRGMLVVLQGMDTSGKDGAIEHVFSGVNPQGCAVVSFKQPSALEIEHDYLWRIHAQTPRRGMITIFNRSHYESVLVERVHELAPKSVWS